MTLSTTPQHPLSPIKGGKNWAGFIERSRIRFRMRHWHLRRRLKKPTVVTTAQGRYHVILGSEDPIGKSLYVFRRHELDFMNTAIAFLREQSYIPRRGSGVVMVKFVYGDIVHKEIKYGNSYYKISF